MVQILQTSWHNFEQHPSVNSVIERYIVYIMYSSLKSWNEKTEGLIMHTRLIVFLKHIWFFSLCIASDFKMLITYALNLHNVQGLRLSSICDDLMFGMQGVLLDNALPCCHRVFLTIKHSICCSLSVTSILTCPNLNPDLNPNVDLNSNLEGRP